MTSQLHRHARANDKAPPSLSQHTHRTSVAKAAEGSRTPRRFARSEDAAHSARSWSAAALCRFPPLFRADFVNRPDRPTSRRDFLVCFLVAVISVRSLE